MVDEVTNDPFLGRVLDDRFRIDELIARGGMGAVYRGVQLSVKRPVAIKIIPPQFLTGPNSVQRLMREAETLSTLAHPNVVGFVDFGQDQGTTYLVMELIEGETLTSFLVRTSPGRSFVVEAMKQICSALAEVHQAGVVHRDLKPSNVLVSRLADGSLRLRIVDFGIVRMPKVATLSDVDTVLGTPQYVSPEQAYGQEVDGRSDLFSLGCIAYLMITGAPPWDGDSGLEIIGNICRTPHPPLTDESWPHDLRALVHDMLRKSPDERPESARAVLERLEEIADTHELDRVRAGENDEIYALAETAAFRVQSPETDPGPGSTSPSSTLRVLAVSLPLLAVVAAVVTWMVWSSGDEAPTTSARDEQDTMVASSSEPSESLDEETPSEPGTPPAGSMPARDESPEVANAGESPTGERPRSDETAEEEPKPEEPDREVAEREVKPTSKRPVRKEGVKGKPRKKTTKKDENTRTERPAAETPGEKTSGGTTAPKTTDGDDPDDPLDWLHNAPKE